MTGQRRPGRSAPYVWFTLLWGCDALSELTRVCLFTRTVFLLINTLLVSPLSISVEMHFYKARRRGCCHWLLVSVARIRCSPCRSLTSVSAQEWNPASSCYRPGPPYNKIYSWWNVSFDNSKLPFLKVRKKSSIFLLIFSTFNSLILYLEFFF